MNIRLTHYLLCLISLVPNLAMAQQTTAAVQFNIETVCLKIGPNGKSLEIFGHSSQIPVYGNPSLEDILRRSATIGPNEIRQYPHSVVIEENLVQVKGEANKGDLSYFVFAPFHDSVPTTFTVGMKIGFHSYGSVANVRLGPCQ